MPLPHNQWIEILKGGGPGTWKLVQALFREENIDQGNWCRFTLNNPQRTAGDPYACFLTVRVEGVTRTSTSFLVTGFIEELNGREWESLANEFRANYNPETREGLIMIGEDVAA
jgi:hypothetical protein